MTTSTIPNTGGPSSVPYQPARWVYINPDNTLTEISYLNNFIFNNIEYNTQELFLKSEQKIKDLGFYKIIVNYPIINSFQHVVTNPDLAVATINHGEKNIYVKLEVNSHTWLHIKDVINSEISKQLDKFAQQRGYDNVVSCVSYANSTNITYKEEALYCMQLRDQVWAIITDWINKVDNYEIEMPGSMEQIYKKLPEFVWPT